MAAWATLTLYLRDWNASDLFHTGRFNVKYQKNVKRKREMQHTTIVQMLGDGWNEQLLDLIIWSHAIKLLQKKNQTSNDGKQL